MAENLSTQSPTRNQDMNPAVNEVDPNSLHHWCHHCEKRVLIETLEDLPDVICKECNNGFVESISAVAMNSTPVPSFRSPELFFDRFRQDIRRIVRDSHEEDAPPPPPSEHVDPTDDDYLRIEIGEWNAAEGEDDDDSEGEHSVEVRNEDGYVNRERDNENQDLSDSDQENEVIEDRGDGEEEDDRRRRRRDFLQLRLRDFAARAATRRNRVLDWAEILMGIEDHSVELRFHVPESDTFIGNPGDYVDAAGYEVVLQNLVENDNEGRRGAPPASKEAVEGLENMVIRKEEALLACAICKDSLNVGDMVKKLPCGHEYHGDCIIPWLVSRNSCPICRFELPTDDPEYEEERKKRVAEAGLMEASPSTSPGGGGNYDP
ncbi:E3 ubiquitin-protein ligase CIP8-like isoform X2 [Olea europaea var. sylvestris]|uniref:E3 ubiquitin-protein ligase CIP8-like isoform X1 n=1 Tax=Olea europaea var. sylvestris TaxID=158386 RepID=UPI000C1CF7CC|nr:E3 ubiquitin-protein ligase CIP8-like isoform X1 [Olea europaea var. sylvestris]XP_022884718.1 E3 ubiquitin-protein ligase CIP8-like isoform X2 [Olea europaea var. sylvestris]